MAATTQHRPLQSSPLSFTTTTNYKASKPASPFSAFPQKKKAMSITQTYYLAHKARAKLANEAARADHDLRLLVGHANLLDSLMLELADAEREQESWFNQSVRGAEKQQQQQQEEKKERHIQWADSVIPEELDEEDFDSDSSSDLDSESDSDDDIEMQDVIPLRKVPSRQALNNNNNDKPLLSVEGDESDDDMEEDDLEEDYAQLELVRTTSHPSNSPPELAHDSDSSEDEDDEESMPPSPPDAILSFSEKEAKEEIDQQKTQSPTQRNEDFYSEGFYLPRRNPARLVSAVTVY